ncbi:Uncharacterized protein Fot_28240 [Forsythia ovata]|uniref:Uncharacterized protein n=1 Tax=Forsythia ovata TaxID=205694 RepID=A0ABD1TNJ4_9LAMI
MKLKSSIGKGKKWTQVDAELLEEKIVKQLEEKKDASRGKSFGLQSFLQFKFQQDDVPPILINPETNDRPSLRRNDGDIDNESDGQDVDDDSVEKISEHSLDDSDFE